MSTAFGLVAPCVSSVPRSAQWLALSAQLPSTSGQGEVAVALHVGGSIVRHCVPRLQAATRLDQLV